MSRYPWRNTSEDIAAEAQSQWETPAGAQEKADAAEQASKEYSDQKLNAHIGTGGSAHANVVAGGAAGFMTGVDKTKLDGIATGANNYVHPATHPPAIIAQDANNRFVTDAEKASWSAKAPSTLVTTTNDGLMSSSDKTKLNGVSSGAEVNQNAFATVNDVSASAKSDTLQITGGTGITISTDPASKKVTVTATGTATPGAHASSHITGGTDVIPNAVTNGSSGLMSGSDAQFVRIEGETKSGAQSKADAALVSAKGYTDSQLATATSAATASTLVKRDANARFKAAAPSATDDVARKAEVDAAISTAASDATSKANTVQTALNTAVNGWRIYNDLTALGLTVGSETMEAIAAAMADKSELRITKVTSNTSTAYPATTGILFVRRYTVNRIELRFIQGNSNGLAREWIGYYDSNISPTFTGWNKVVTSETIIEGSGSPEGVITATVGKLYLRSDGGASTTLYVKQSGTGNTGWIAK